MQNKRQLLSLIIPCYNEEESIRLFLKETQKFEFQLSNYLDFEYIFVNDGSKDKTLEVLRDISSKISNVHYLSFSRNFGKESALLAGLEHAQGDYVAVMDADLQDPPELLIDMYKKYKRVMILLGHAERIEKVNHQ